jgi:hypothetical protein
MTGGIAVALPLTSWVANDTGSRRSPPAKTGGPLPQNR